MTDIQLDALSDCYSAAGSLLDTHHCDLNYFDRVWALEESVAYAKSVGLTDDQIYEYTDDLYGN